MKLNFTKMHGCGNDYVYFNCFDQTIADPAGLAVRLSDRHKGIGGDGIVLICPSKTADAKMRMFNIDGSEGRMCGNAIRCVGKYLYDNKIAAKDTIDVETLSGTKRLTIFADGGVCSAVSVRMGQAELNPSEIPAKLDGERAVAVPAEFAGREYKITLVGTGNPHCVTFVEDVDSLNLEEIGPVFENSPLFPERINTEFVKVIGEKELQMRVWERGSGETMACGTGACATVVAACENGFCRKGGDVTVHLRGGDLVVNYTDDQIVMTGPAAKAFDGTVEI